MASSRTEESGPDTVHSNQGTESEASRDEQDGTIFALLADGSLIKVVPESGQVESKISLGRFSNPGVGRYLAPSKDGETLFALVTGGQDGPSRVVVIDIATFRVREHHQLENGVVFRSLVVGPNTGHLYLFGNRQGKRIEDPAGNYREESVIVTVLDPADGRMLESQTIREADGRAWSVYRGEVSLDERQLFVSYHGDTDGIDWIEITAGGLERCQDRTSVYQGCIPGHGNVEAYDDRLLIATGSPQIKEAGQEGRVVREWDTKLENNHLMDFAVDVDNDRLFAVGSCGYTGGLSTVNLETDQVELLVPARSGLASPSIRGRAVCGERIAFGPDSLLVVGRIARPVPQPQTAGSLLLVDGGSGRKIRTVDTPAEMVDVLVAPRL